MIDPYLIWTPILALPIVGLLRFLGCAQIAGLGGFYYASPLAITDPGTLPEGAESQAYPGVTFQATGGTPPYTWSMVPSAPAGLLIGPKTGLLGGTPSAGFDGSVAVTVADSANPKGNASVTVTLNVLGIDQTSLNPGRVNVLYAAPLTSTGGVGAITWAAAGLPPGLGIDAGGNITGMPSKSGAYILTVVATDGKVSAKANVSLNISTTFPIFNTAVDGAGNLLGDGAVDPHYSLIQSADPAFPGPNALVAVAGSLPQGWVNGAASKWIAPQANALLNNSVGDYKYQIQFDLTGFDPATASIGGSIWSDNAAFWTLNGGAEQAIDNSQTVLNIPVGSGFVAGQNTLVFRVNNAGTTPNPTGMRVEPAGTAVTP